MQLVSDQYFAEGLTDWNNTLIQLTWQSHVAFVYDRATFRLLRTFSYTGEGWGLTHDAKSLILSDGTATLRFFDPATSRKSAALQSRTAASQSPNSTNSNTFTAKSTPTSGTPIASRASPRPRAVSSAGSTSRA